MEERKRVLFRCPGSSEKTVPYHHFTTRLLCDTGSYKGCSSGKIQTMLSALAAAVDRDLLVDPMGRIIAIDMDCASEEEKDKDTVIENIKKLFETGGFKRVWIPKEYSSPAYDDACDEYSSSDDEDESDVYGMKESGKLLFSRPNSSEKTEKYKMIRLFCDTGKRNGCSSRKVRAVLSALAAVENRDLLVDPTLGRVIAVDVDLVSKAYQVRSKKVEGGLDIEKTSPRINEYSIETMKRSFLAEFKSVWTPREFLMEFGFNFGS